MLDCYNLFPLDPLCCFKTLGRYCILQSVLKNLSNSLVSKQNELAKYFEQLCIRKVIIGAGVMVERGPCNKEIMGSIPAGRWAFSSSILSNESLNKSL